MELSRALALRATIASSSAALRLVGLQSRSHHPALFMVLVPILVLNLLQILVPRGKAWFKVRGSFRLLLSQPVRMAGGPCSRADCWTAPSSCRGCD